MEDITSEKIQDIYIFEISVL